MWPLAWWRVSHTTGLSGWCFFSPEWSVSSITGTLRNYIQCAGQNWLRAWSSSLSALTRTTYRSFHHCMIFFVCKCTQAYGQCQVWYSEAPEWVGWAITQVLSWNRWHKQLDLLSLSCSDSSPLTKSLIQIATSGSVKMLFNLLADFWIGLRSEYSALANHTVKTLMPFATTYLCESGFSALTSLKTKYRHRLCVEDI